MNNKEVSVIVNLLKEGKELFQEIKEARSDERITWLERFKIALEAGDVVKAMTAFKGFKIESMDDSHIEEIVDFIIEATEEDIPVSKQQAIYILNVVRYSTLTIESFVN